MSNIENKMSNNSFYTFVIKSTVFKLIIFSVFIFFVKDVIINIFIFFGIESNNIYAYVSWFIFLLFLVVILPTSNGRITV